MSGACAPVTRWAWHPGERRRSQRWRVFDTRITVWNSASYRETKGGRDHEWRKEIASLTPGRQIAVYSAHYVRYWISAAWRPFTLLFTRTRPRLCSDWPVWVMDLNCVANAERRLDSGRLRQRVRTRIYIAAVFPTMPVQNEILKIKTRTCVNSLTFLVPRNNCLRAQHYHDIWSLGDHCLIHADRNILWKRLILWRYHRSQNESWWVAVTRAKAMQRRIRYVCTWAGTFLNSWWNQAQFNFFFFEFVSFRVDVRE